MRQPRASASRGWMSWSSRALAAASIAIASVALAALAMPAALPTDLLVATWIAAIALALAALVAILISAIWSGTKLLPPATARLLTAGAVHLLFALELAERIVD